MPIIYTYMNNPRCLDCHAGNIGGNVASWSTPLVFRLAQHDMHCTAGWPRAKSPNSVPDWYRSGAQLVPFDAFMQGFLGIRT